jgi:hypothetical protein
LSTARQEWATLALALFALGDKRVPERDWHDKNSSWAFLRDIPSPAEALFEDLLPELAAMFMNENGRVVEAMAETNAQPFGFDTGEVESAELNDGENRINFKVSLVLAGEQDVERPFNGDKLNPVVTGVVVRTAEKWAFAEVDVERIETNAWI